MGGTVYQNQNLAEETGICIADTRMIRLPRCCGDKPEELWMICEDTNHGDRNFGFV
jgi:hypothetical protein